MEGSSRRLWWTVKIWSCDLGAAALEFAIVGPMMIVLLLGALSYGGYFWLAHATQQLANDSARAAMGGIDAEERAALAQANLDSELSFFAFLDPSRAVVAVAEDENSVSVRVTYDAAESPFFALSKLIPMPAAQIEQMAVVRLGGY